MKNAIVICLLAVSGKICAQNIGIKDLKYVLISKNKTSIDSLLEPKGFSSDNGNSNSFTTTTSTGLNNSFGSVISFQKIIEWKFSVKSNSDNQFFSKITRITDNSDSVTEIRFETTSPYFYTSLLNELTTCGFKYAKTKPTKGSVILSFVNDTEEINITIGNKYSSTSFEFSISRINQK